jgi:hypothetical protein
MAQRQLILVTKVLQNLANDTLPGAKEVPRLIIVSWPCICTGTDSKV